jgi:hypothetical protein
LLELVYVGFIKTKRPKELGFGFPDSVRIGKQIFRDFLDGNIGGESVREFHVFLKL